jgi:uracil-DNA glycosylase family 4
MEKELAYDLERFVREQAARFGDVISYVPPPKPVEEVPAKRSASSTVSPEAKTSEAKAPKAGSKKTAVSDAVATSVIPLTELETKLSVHQSEPWFSASTLEELESKINGCQKCHLWETRTKFVFGVGDPNAKLMVIGEAPGADEDEQGEPFVGRAGQLLNKMLAAVQFERNQVFIANILKSRPPNNRDPKPEEVAACEPYLWKQISIIKPKLILCLGRIAGQNLLKTTDTLGKMRGQIFDFCGIQVIVTYHPAALLRNPDWKHGAWEDLQKIRRMYDELA